MQTHPFEAVEEPSWRRAASRGLALATGGYSAILVFATHYPKPESLLGRTLPSDKLMHFVAYGVLGGLVAATLVAYGRRDVGLHVRVVVVLAIAAIFDELTQPYFGRAAEPLDWVCDCIGLAAGAAVVVFSSWAWERGSRRS
jgi:VanZ family protein